MAEMSRVGLEKAPNNDLEAITVTRKPIVLRARPERTSAERLGRYTSTHERDADGFRVMSDEISSVGEDRG